MNEITIRPPFSAFIPPRLSDGTECAMRTTLKKSPMRGIRVDGFLENSDHIDPFNEEHKTSFDSALAFFSRIWVDPVQNEQYPIENVLRDLKELRWYQRMLEGPQYRIDDIPDGIFILAAFYQGWADIVEENGRKYAYLKMNEEIHGYLLEEIANMKTRFEQEYGRAALQLCNFRFSRAVISFVIKKFFS